MFYRHIISKLAEAKNAIEAFNTINMSEVNLIFSDINMSEFPVLSFAKSINRSYKEEVLRKISKKGL